jgi:hypothetical protein
VWRRARRNVRTAFTGFVAEMKASHRLAKTEARCRPITPPNIIASQMRLDLGSLAKG